MAQTTTDSDYQGVAAELMHWDDRLHSEMSMGEMIDQKAREVLSKIAPEIEQAKQRLYELDRDNREGDHENDPELRRLLGDIRQCFKDLDLKDGNGGPPLA